MIGAQDPLQASLTRAIERVGPYLRAYRVYLEPPASAETVAAPDLVRREPLRHYAARAVKEWSDRPWDEDPRAAVSRLMADVARCSHRIRLRRPGRQTAIR